MTQHIPAAPEGVRHINGETGEVTECMLAYVGRTPDGMADWEVITPIDYDLRRGDKITIKRMPGRTGISFPTSMAKHD